MVTVHNQQSQLARRAVITESAFQSSGIKDTKSSRGFSCGGLGFLVFDDPSPEVVTLTRSRIAAGESAAVIPAHFTSPAAAFFDMDATVIAEESLVEIARLAGKYELIESITAKAMAGGMDFRESLALRLSELKGIRRDDVLTISPHINKGMPEISVWAASHGIPLYLISGGFVDLAEPVARQLRFRDFKANRFAWDDSGLMLGHAEGDIIDANGKLNAVERWCDHLGTTPAQCVAVGDGANDLPMLRACGWAVGFQPKKALWHHIHCANHTGDHRFMLRCLNV
jgi:phosphoserine phosphatase